MNFKLKHRFIGLAVALGACVIVAGVYVIATVLHPATPAAAPVAMTHYADADHGFAFDYPSVWNLNERATDLQDNNYLGLTSKFFLSLADPTTETKPETIARFYAADGVTADQFTAALLASDPGNVTIKETTDVNQNGLAMKKVVSTTASGYDKTHYLFYHGETLVIISVILQEDEHFAPVFASLSAE